LGKIDIIEIRRITVSNGWEIPWYDIDDVYPYFGYVNRRAALRAIRVGRFPIPSYILSGRMRVVDREVFYDFFRQKRPKQVS